MFDKQISDLHKQATALDSENRIQDAIACLKEAQNLILSSTAIFPPETLCRLPVFLQRGGRFQEAIEEFNKLLDTIPARMLKTFTNLPDEIALNFAHGERAVIYNKMRVVYKREKLLEEASKFETLAAEERKKAEKALKLVDKYQAQRSRAFEKARLESKKAKNRDALEEFHKKYPNVYR